MLFAAGSPTAIAPDGSTRALHKGDAVEEGDLLLTGDGRLQLVFKDHAVVALYPDTHFRVERYRYGGAGDDSDGVVLRLLKGGLRTISGLVGKSNRADYRMEARVATIGIRGTEYGLQLGETLVGNVGDGAIDVCNTAGCLRVGISQAFMVPSSTEKPVLAQLQARLPSPAVDNAAAEGDDDAGDDAAAATPDGARVAAAARGDTGKSARDRQDKPGQEKAGPAWARAEAGRGATGPDDSGEHAPGAKRGHLKYFRDEDVVKGWGQKAAGKADPLDAVGAPAPSVLGSVASVPSAGAASTSVAGKGPVAASPGSTAAPSGLSNPGVAGLPSTAAASGYSAGTPAALLPALAKKLSDPLKIPPGLLKKQN